MLNYRNSVKKEAQLCSGNLSLQILQAYSFQWKGLLHTDMAEEHFPWSHIFKLQYLRIIKAEPVL